MKKEYIIGIVIGVVFVLAMILCIVIAKIGPKKAEFIPTISKVKSLDEKGNVTDSEEIAKLEGEDKSKLDEYVKQIGESAQKEKYSLIIFVDYNIRVSEHISIKIKSDIKEYVYYVDDTKEGSEREIATRAPEGFVEWVMSKVNNK